MELLRLRRKIARAKEHASDFERKWDEFLCIHKQTSFLDPHPHRPDHEVLKVRILDPVPLQDLADIAADAICNLRSVLDNAGYLIAVASGKAKPKHAAFPFAGSAASFDSQIKGRSNDLPKEIHAVFRAYRPYRGGDDALWALNQACNTNKHERLLRVDFAAQLGEASGVRGLVRLLETPIWDPFKQEIEIATFVKGSDPHYEIEIEPFVAFDEIEGIRGARVLAVLDYWISLVGEIISAMETEAARLGIGK